jgi:brefeldin A-inhibited guanine nucleotide-exchange protein
VNIWEKGNFELNYRDEKNIAIMHHFVELFDFSGLSFLEALRNFLRSFKLPGEAQKIDRFMLKFAETFLRCNKGTFNSAGLAVIN